MPQYKLLERGDPAPWFRQRSSVNQDFVFDTAAGRYIVLCFFASAADEQGSDMLKILQEERALFDDEKIAFFGVSLDPRDESEGRARTALPGIRHFWDFDGAVSKLYGAIPVDASGPVGIRRMWMVLDPSMRVRAVFVARPDAGERHELAAFLKSLPPVDAAAGFPTAPPVILLNDVFEPELCQRLIDLYETDGGTDSGFMREVDGKTVGVFDHKHKRRSDFTIEDRDLIATLQRKIHRRVASEILKVHQFKVSRMERYIVSCYDSSNGGHFRAHRDNTTKGTAHRRFAVSINLNAEFAGGEIGFPEYGPRTFKMPPGGACVFSCSLLHQVSPVTSGRRFAFLPFLYDEEAAKLREENNRYLGEGVGAYRA